MSSVSKFSLRSWQPHFAQYFHRTKICEEDGQPLSAYPDTSPIKSFFSSSFPVYNHYLLETFLLSSLLINALNKSQMIFCAYKTAEETAKSRQKKILLIATGGRCSVVKWSLVKKLSIVFFYDIFTVWKNVSDLRISIGREKTKSTNNSIFDCVNFCPYL